MRVPELQFLICSSCHGSGCDVCQHHGIAGMFGDTALMGLERVDSDRVHAFYSKRIFTRAGIALGCLIGAAGLAMTGYTIYHYADALISGVKTIAELFQDRDQKQLALFWVGLLGFMYAWYRATLARTSFTAMAPVGETQLSAVSWETVAHLARSKRRDVTRSWNIRIWNVLKSAEHISEKFGKHAVTPLHIFSALLTNSSEIRGILMRLGIDFKSLVERLGSVLISEDAGTGIFLTVAARKVFYKAYARAYALREETVTPTALVAVIISESDELRDVFMDIGVTQQQLEHAVQWLVIDEQIGQQYRAYRSKGRLRSKYGLDRAMTAVATPFLNKVSEDLTERARRGQLTLCVGREKEFTEIFRLAETGSTPSMVLVGRRGVGTRAIIEGIAQRIVGDDVPAVYAEKRLVRLDVPTFISGATATQVHERLLEVLHECSRARNVILCIENIHELAGISVGGGQTLDVAEVLSEAVGKRLVTVIATSHPDEYVQHVERTSLGSALQKVIIDEPDEDGAIGVLELKAGQFEYTHGVVFSYQALEAAVKLTMRYVHDQFLPEKAIRILEETAVMVRSSRGKDQLVTAADVATVLSAKTHIPISSATADEAQKLLHLEDELHARVIGQEEAVKAVASALRRARAELRDQKRPIASFLFLGPTGVGKTELSKAIAQVYFGSEKNMVRLDMSEFQDATSINRLIGAPAGVSGDSQGQLTESVRQNPFTIVLLDELEKAHKDILNIFLQVMDDGRLSDGKGNVIDFTNTIIIATSNAGAAYIQDSINAGSVDLQRIKQHLIEEELRPYYRPEFLNRFDSIIVFKPLGLEQIQTITKLMLAEVAKKLEAKQINFRATEAAIAELARSGFDPQFGARPLRRAIQERVDNALADLLLQQKLSRRDVVVLNEGGALTVEKAEQL